ncbi:DUF1295 domain-containing protein [Catenulispora sp. NL8]|uniref:DUF1295 domain-containing protein n=1 Tax=Catenulispora pinistramenti TaxID=2705254 RepID=A0ABS5KYJ8_9ACTN|nr:DUF1295 domain-containing protein [Catenulispora pinistramenti]MBS2551131.1 DUF1295 domain-containing protein [Catenulispora pinistramenti]
MLDFAAVSAVDMAVLIVVFTAAFGVAVARQRYRYVDVVWGAAFALVAVLTMTLTSGGSNSGGHGDGPRRWLLTLGTVIWGLRLSAHIAWRGHGAPEDPRYTSLLAKAGGNAARAAFTRVYLLQALLVWFISLPIQVGLFATGDPGAGRVAPVVSVAAVVGVALWLVGICFETIGDWQLARFKADPANRGRLMTEGLWRYTRHPNYFGDACVWWGLFLIAAGAWPVLLTVLSPVLMTWLLTAGSGKPLMEARLSATRPEYADYVARTSAFIPRPPRGRGPHG